MFLHITTFIIIVITDLRVIIGIINKLPLRNNWNIIINIILISNHYRYVKVVISASPKIKSRILHGINLSWVESQKVRMKFWRKDEPRTSDTSVFGISDLENHFVSLNFNCFAVASIPWYVLSCSLCYSAWNVSVKEICTHASLFFEYTFISYLLQTLKGFRITINKNVASAGFFRDNK